MIMDEKIDTLNLTEQESQLREDIYHLLAILLRQPPQLELLQWLSQLVLDETAQNPMSQCWQRLKISAGTHPLEQILDEYQLIFIGIGRGEVVPYGSWYLSGSLMDTPLLVLRQDLRRLGFTRQASVKEPEDHIAALLEVMGILVQEGDENTQAAFFNQHLSSWYQPLFEDIQQANSAHFYRVVAELALAFLNVEKVRFAQRS